MQPPSRLELARRRLRTARIAAIAGAAAAFGGLALAVRAAHPATSGTTHPLQTPSSLGEHEDDHDDDSFGFGGGSFGSTGGAPQVQSGGS